MEVWENGSTKTARVSGLLDPSEFDQALMRRISAWGLASVALFIGDRITADYNIYLLDHGRAPRLSGAAGFKVCFLIEVAAAFCGGVAAKRGSKWWLFTVVAASLVALSCYFGEL